MKFLRCVLILMAGILSSPAQDDSSPAVSASLPDAIPDGTPSPPAPDPVLPNFVVKSTVVREIDVVEPPPMAGLPPVEGTITATVQLVKDPGLPDPPPPPVADVTQTFLSVLPPQDADSDWTRLVFVSATVFDHSRTLLRCHPNGNSGKEITAWSNLDFNHFRGVSNFEVKTADGGVRRYNLIMGIGDEDTYQRTAVLARHKLKYNRPEIPSLPDGQPAYVIQGTAPDAGAVQLVADLHELYRCEGGRMETAWQARIQAEAEQRAYFLAHPPTPKDVTMNFWERDHPVGMDADSIKKGGGN